MTRKINDPYYKENKLYEFSNPQEQWQGFFHNLMHFMKASDDEVKSACDKISEKYKDALDGLKSR